MLSVNSQRVLHTFKSVAELWGPSGQEKVVADEIVRQMKDLDLPGAKVFVDETGPGSHSDTGNVIVDIPPSLDAPADSPALGLFFHMDRVPARANGVPEDEPVKIALDADGKIHSQDYRTNIAADDRAGYAEIHEALAVLKENQLTHGRIVMVGLTREEVDSYGAVHIDSKHLDGVKYGFALDGSDINELMRGGCSITDFQAEIAGKAAHSGMEPEKGISAIAAATTAIGHLGQLGKVKEGQTLNVAYIQGGQLGADGTPVYNVIPDHAFVGGEFRSLTPNDLTELKQKVEGAFAQAQQESGAEIKLTMTTDAGFYLDDQAPVVTFAQKAMASVGVVAEKTYRMGGSDAGPLNLEKGLPTVLLGNGVHDEHTVQEHIYLQDMAKGAEVVLGLIKTAVEK